MKKLLIILLCLLSGCSNAADNARIKTVYESFGSRISLICINGIEYIMGIGYGNSDSAFVTPSLNKDGKPKECNY